MAKNPGASIRARLLARSKSTGQPFDLILTRFAIERLLYRLSTSAHADRFVLKGAMLLMTWVVAPHRGTRDLDLLGLGTLTAEDAVAAFREIMTPDLNDGVQFDTVGLHVDRIREQLAYGGYRMVTTATIDGAKLKVSIDIGFGDSLEPGVQMIDYPVLLDHAAPRLPAYAPETVVAEKFEAMVALGRNNTRMKDFHDVLVLSRTFPFADDRLATAIAATFARRGTAMPVVLPDALTSDFAADISKRAQWAAFVRDTAINPGPLDAVIAELSVFLMRHAAGAVSSRAGSPKSS